MACGHLRAAWTAAGEGFGCPTSAVQQRVQRNLRVDDDRAVIRQSHHHVRLDGGVLADDAQLFREVDSAGEPGDFDDAAQLDFTPASSLAQDSRPRQVGSCRVEVQRLPSATARSCSESCICESACPFATCWTPDASSAFTQMLRRVLDQPIASLGSASSALLVPTGMRW